MDLHQKYPALSDLRRKAKRRVPHFMWEYLVSATGVESATARNRKALDNILFTPSVLLGDIEPDLKTEFLGRTYDRPFGVAPVGMSGGIWPNAERSLATKAAQHGFPYCLSSVATELPETIGPIVGQEGWFQLYPPRDPEIRSDILNRVKDAGFHTLVLTVDVPGPSRRERQTRSGLVQPIRVTPKIAAQIAMRPSWAVQTLKSGRPRMRLIDDYAKTVGTLPSNNHVGYLLRTSPDWTYLAQLRNAWNGPLIVKGVLKPDDAARLGDEGVDAIWVSNHAGRQFDAGPATIDVLAEIRGATDLPILFDSGVESGLDILRAIALGANFVMLGRAFHYGLAALGSAGIDHVIDLFEQDMRANMIQLGATQLNDLSDCLRYR